MPDNKNGSTGEVKRKRGRPPKNKDGKENGVKNEGISKIEMDKSLSTINNSSNQEMITLSAVQQRWAGIFNKYSNVMGQADISVLTSMSHALSNNPWVQNKRVKEIIAESGEKINRSDLQDKVQDPGNHELELQKVSWALYFQDYTYQNLMRLNREIGIFHYYALPENVDKEKFNKEDFIKERRRVNEILKVFNPASTFKDIMMQITNEGKCSYYTRLSYSEKQINFCLLQKINPDRVKIVGFGSENKYRVATDLAIFMNPAYDINQYPDFIQKAWLEMQTQGIVTKDENGKWKVNPNKQLQKEDIFEYDNYNNTWYYWYFCPQGMVETFGTDLSHPLAIPDAIGIFNDVLSISDYSWLAGAVASKAATGILVGTVPLAEKGQVKAGMDSLAISSDSVLGWTDLFSQNVSEQIYGFFSPFEDMKYFSIDDQLPAAQTLVSNKLRDVVNSTGLGSLVSLDSRPSISSVKTTQLIYEERINYYYRQFESYLNRLINNNFDLKYKWKITLWDTIFSHSDEMRQLKEMILNGVKGVLPRYLSGLGLTLDDYESSYEMIEAMGIKILKDETIYQVENNKEMQKESLDANEQLQIKTAKIKETGTVGDGKVGRPKMKDSDIENDNTAASADAGNNVSAIKEFAALKLGDEGIVSDLNEDEIMEVLQEELIAEIENNHNVGEQFKVKK